MWHLFLSMCPKMLSENAIMYLNIRVFVIILSLRGWVECEEYDGKRCTFDGYVINSITISSFLPEIGYCDTVTGAIRIDETSDVTHQQLTNALGRIGIVMGNVAVVNTAFTNLSFFSDLYVVTGDVDVKEYALVIMNNSKLETMEGALVTTHPVARIENNPLLDPNCTHVYLYYSTQRRIRRNRLNCGCELDGPVTNRNINEIEDNCDLILGDLIIHGANSPSSEVLHRKFAMATLVTGEVSIVGTNYTDLRFLENVAKIEVFYDIYAPAFVEKFLRIENNSALERLSWPELEFVNSATLRIAGNPKLCYTTRELAGLLSAQYIDSIEGNVCEEIHPEEYQDRVCRIGTATSIAFVPDNCKTLVGDLTIDHQSRTEELWKLYNVTHVYGSITIHNSSLNGFSPLWKLREIYNFAKNHSALVIDSNSYLKSIYFTNMYRMVSDLPSRIVENPILSIAEEECTTFDKTTASRIDYYGNKANCQVNIKKSVSSVVQHIHVLMLTTAFALNGHISSD